MFTLRTIFGRRQSKRAATKAPLQLELLENRLTPSVAANDLFVSSLYQGLLGRPADAGGLTFWTGQLNTGASPTQVANEIATSFEAGDRDVQLFYDALLNRNADAGGLGYWDNQLQSGASLNDVKAGIIGSDEFFSQAGGTNVAFLNSLYQHELGRPVDAGGLLFWENRLASGETRNMVAGQVLATPEANEVKVASFFQDVLGRMPDTGGLNYWAGQLNSGVSESNVLAGILGSNEYLASVQKAATATPQTDANQAALNYINQNALFTGPLPNAEYLVHSIPTIPSVPNGGGNVDNTPNPPTGNGDMGNNLPGNGDNTIINSPIVTCPPVDYCPPIDTCPPVDTCPPIDTCPPVDTGIDCTTVDYSTDCSDTADCSYVDTGSTDTGYVDSGDTGSDASFVDASFDGGDFSA